MVMILPKAQSFSERLGTGLGAGFGQGLAQASQLGSQVAVEREKAKAKKGFYSDLFGNSSSQGQGSTFQPLNSQQETILALQDPQAFNAYQNLKQSSEKVTEKEKTKQNLESTLGEMTDTLLEGRLGKTLKRFGTKGRRDVQYFDTLGTQLESIGKEMVSKGVLSAPRFAYLLSNLPSSGKTDAANAGALEAWAKELNLEVPGIENLKSLYQSPSEIKKKTVPESSKDRVRFNISNPEHKAKRDQLLKKFKGDREKVKAALDREFTE